MQNAPTLIRSVLRMKGFIGMMPRGVVVTEVITWYPHQMEHRSPIFLKITPLILLPKSIASVFGEHLITNPEWMTIARNVEQVANNWCNKDGTGCGNSPGTPGKILANGHNDSVPYRALQAGNDSQPCFGTTADGSNVCGGVSSQKRTLQIFNGNIIWDFAGNVWQWIDVTIPLKDEPISLNAKNKFVQWVWEEFQSVPYDPYNMPSNPNWNSAQGFGRIFHYNSYCDWVINPAL